MAVKGSVNKSPEDSELDLQSDMSLDNQKLRYMLVQEAESPRDDDKRDTGGKASAL